LLRFHPHPSQCRSIGQTIGLTAYPPQRAAIFTMLLLTRTFPAYFRLRALFEASDISTTSEPTVPSGILSFGPADPVCARHLSCKGSLTPRLKSGACARPVMVRHDGQRKNRVYAGRYLVFVVVRSFASSRYLSADNTESLSYIGHCQNDGCFCRSL